MAQPADAGQGVPTDQGGAHVVRQQRRYSSGASWLPGRPDGPIRPEPLVPAEDYVNVLVHRRKLSFELRGQPKVVAVQERNPRRRAGPDSEIARPFGSQPGSRDDLDSAIAGEHFGEALTGAIVSSVVDDHQSPVRECLRLHRANGLSRQFKPVSRWNYHINQGHA
ncbi:hypothetical protein BN10_720043 [Phycicoccus elongatus Lp2]|uniref:Uncharacterized protein n=1 Tax=Phycicoccus elongatus Lp2 TaxID=1193181 RepID=N0E624_9MICO|nr:hypothetical protein BN10_720043 [Phycicoccus elongatus Lp2]